mmetsp:Transcript_13658/g.36129  ORF Transcript_13658/g.36129 Transcript_13658/m.36129 type:complete len:259 (-) Transcript_13658:556-1332(-)
MCAEFRKAGWTWAAAGYWVKGPPRVAAAPSIPGGGPASSTTTERLAETTTYTTKSEASTIMTDSKGLLDGEKTEDRQPQQQMQEIAKQQMQEIAMQEIEFAQMNEDNKDFQCRHLGSFLMFQDIKTQKWVQDAPGPARQSMEKMCAEFRKAGWTWAAAGYWVKGPPRVAAAPSIPGGGPASSTTTERLVETTTYTTKSEAPTIMTDSKEPRRRRYSIPDVDNIAAPRSKEESSSAARGLSLALPSAAAAALALSLARV